MELKIGKVREDNEELKKETEKLNNQLKELNKSMNAQLNDKISQLTKVQYSCRTIIIEAPGYMYGHVE